MKKLITLFVCVMLACMMLVGCGGKNTVLKESDQFIVLTPSDDFAGKKLVEFMDYTKEQGTLDYTASQTQYGIFIESVNGIANGTSTYWMLYTDDAENSTPAWGTIEYKEKTYASASLGATDLVIAKGCTYIWVYTSFNAQ